MIVAAVAVHDSAWRQQPARTLSAALPIRVWSEEVNFTQHTQTTVPLQPSSTCSCAIFTLRLAHFRQGVPPGTPVLLRFEVTADAANVAPRLFELPLVAGPFAVTSGLADTDGGPRCESNLAPPTVIAEFAEDEAAFLETAADKRNELARLLALDPSRVDFLTASRKSIFRVEPATTEKWNGVKVPIVFRDPTATSTNKRSATDLSAEFVALQPACDRQGSLGLRRVYYQRDDRSCNTETFQRQLAESRACTLAGNLTMCECYSGEGRTMADSALVCLDQPSLLEDLRFACLELSFCQDAKISAVCDNIEQKKVNLTGMWVGAGAVFTFLFGYVVFSRIKGAKTKAAKVTLNKSAKQRK